MFKALACAINGLTEELRFAREERNCDLASQLDVLLQRTRRTRKRAEQLARKLGRLDDQTP